MEFLVLVLMIIPLTLTILYVRKDMQLTECKFSNEVLQTKIVFLENKIKRLSK